MQKRLLILAEMLLAGAVSGRLAVRALLNLLLGGTLFFGGIFYEGQHEKTRKEEKRNVTHPIRRGLYQRGQKRRQGDSPILLRQGLGLV